MTATYPVHANSNSLFTTAGFGSMLSIKPDKGYSSETGFSTVTFTSEAGYEKRRLVSRRPKRKLDLTYTNIHGLAKYAIEQFYKERSGNYEAFYFDKTHINESGTMIVRFDGEVKATQVLSTGANVLNNYYTVTFTLQETYD